MAVSKALMKIGEKALTKGSEKAIEKAITKATEKAVNKALTKSATSSLTGVLGGKLAKNSGSTLDGLLGKSSGLTLKNAKLPKAVGLADEYAGTDLAKTAKQEIAEVANLPADYPEPNKMIEEGKLATAHGTDKFGTGARTTRNYELTGKPLTYDEKNSLVNAIKDGLPEAEAVGINLEPEDFVNENQLRLIDQTKEPTTRSIPVDKVNTRKKNVKVSRPVADAGVDTAVSETPTNSELAGQIAELKEKIGSTGGAGGGRIGGGGTATDMPGSEGFNVKLKDGGTTNIQLRNNAVGSTKQQRAVRKLDDMTAKSVNANNKQYAELVGKSKSIDNYYKTVAERMRAENIDQANLADKAQSALSLREDIKQQGLAYADAKGVTIDLSGIDNTIGLSATQKRKLSELGLSLDEMVGGNGLVSPSQAEQIYTTLRDYGYNWEDSKDALTSMAGKSVKKEAEAVRDLIDKTMDSINVDYKTSLLEEAAKNGEDPAYLRRLAGKSDFKFSDLRKDQSDWLAMSRTAGNKIKEEPTLNVFGVDTGVKNPFTEGAEKIKEKIYERQAYGAGGAGGNMGSGTIPPAGGYGAEGNINFIPVGGEKGTLGNLLGKAKSAGLVGAGILGGMALGGGGGSNGGSNDFSSMSYTPTTTAETEIDPYSELAIGGYSYNQLEAGYTAALMAGDSDAAKLIANMMGMLDDKVERYNNAKKNTSDSSGIASKQKAALNVLSGLMQNYQAQGPIGGRFTQLLNAITGGGYNPSVSAYDSGASGSLGTIIKALSDTGALSEGDHKRALELLPKTTDSEAAAKMKYQQLIQILQGAGAQ